MKGSVYDGLDVRYLELGGWDLLVSESEPAGINGRRFRLLEGPYVPPPPNHSPLLGWGLWLLPCTMDALLAGLACSMGGRAS